MKAFGAQGLPGWTTFSFCVLLAHLKEWTAPPLPVKMAEQQAENKL